MTRDQGFVREPMPFSDCLGIDDNFLDANNLAIRWLQQNLSIAVRYGVEGTAGSVGITKDSNGLAPNHTIYTKQVTLSCDIHD